MRLNLEKNLCMGNFQRMYRSNLSKCFNILASPLLFCVPALCSRIILVMLLLESMTVYSVQIRAHLKNGMKHLNKQFVKFMPAQ